MLPRSRGPRQLGVLVAVRVGARAESAASSRDVDVGGESVTSACLGSAWSSALVRLHLRGIPQGRR